MSLGYGQSKIPWILDKYTWLNKFVKMDPLRISFSIPKYNAYIYLLGIFLKLEVFRINLENELDKTYAFNILNTILYFSLILSLSLILDQCVIGEISEKYLIIILCYFFT